MLRQTLLLAVAALAVALATPADALSWGCYHAGYTHYGYGGVQHYGRTGFYGGGRCGSVSHYGSTDRYGSGGYHYGATSAHGGSYGGYHYGGYHYGYSAGYARRW